jgi:putative FmdB family regulatory protein
MPLYPYRCTQCGHRFEKIQSFSSEPETECPKCKGKLERQLTAPRFHFKGSGWYINDYASKGSAGLSDTPSTSSTPAPSSTESKPAAAPAAAPAPAPAAAGS